MNFRNFTLDSHEAQLLLFRDIDLESSFPIVKIYCYWVDDEGDDRMHEEKIQFENESSAQFFIFDFSNESAHNWFKKNVPVDEFTENNQD